MEGGHAVRILSVYVAAEIDESLDFRLVEAVVDSDQQWCHSLLVRACSLNVSASNELHELFLVILFQDLSVGVVQFEFAK